MPNKQSQAEYITCIQKLLDDNILEDRREIIMNRRVVSLGNRSIQDMIDAGEGKAALREVEDIILYGEYNA